MKQKMKLITSAIMMLVLSVSFVACEKEDADVAVEKSRVALNFSATGGSAPESAALKSSSWKRLFKFHRNDGVNIEITNFKINVGEIELEFDDDYHYDMSFNKELLAQFNGRYDGDDEIEFKKHFVIELVADGQWVDNQTIDGLYLPVAAYSEIEFDMKRSRDQGSSMYGKSILIEGKIGDTPFVFASDKSFDFEIEFVKPFIVKADQENSLTINFDMNKIFMNNTLNFKLALDKGLLEGIEKLEFFYYDDNDEYEKNNKLFYEIAEDMFEFIEDMLDYDFDD